MAAEPIQDSSGMDVLGLVIAGGRARRMGGTDKALAPLSGRPLVAHAFERLGPQCAALAISANGDPSRFSPFGVPVVADDVPGFAGPLAGVLAGLELARASGFDLVASLAVDTPFAPRDLVARLHAARRAAGADITVAESGGRMHHVVALWPASLATDLRRALAEEGLRKVESYLARHRVAVAEWPIGAIDPFFNVNSPDDLAVAEEMARRSNG